MIAVGPGRQFEVIGHFASRSSTFLSDAFKKLARLILQP
jgi:hypothetical protein